MSAPPIISLNFANDTRQPLHYLTHERKAITKILDGLERAGKIIVKHEAEAATQDIFEVFRTYGSQLAILHYGGHANAQSVLLNDAFLLGQTLAKLVEINAQETAQGVALIFLNGCATQNLVNSLLQAGVRCVIATQTSVGDQSASNFAIQFYEALVEGKTLQGAFETAQLMIQQQIKKPPIRWFSPDNDAFVNLEESQGFAWGLYTKNSNHKHWRLCTNDYQQVLKLDFDLLEQALHHYQYVKVIEVLDHYHEHYPNYRYGQLRSNILHQLDQGDGPKPALVQGLRTYLNELKQQARTMP